MILSGLQVTQSLHQVWFHVEQILPRIRYRSAWRCRAGTKPQHRVTEESFPGANPYLLIGHYRKINRLSSWRWYDKSLRRTQEIVAWLAAEAQVVTKWLQVKRDSRLDSLDVCCLPAAWCDTGDLQSGNLCFAERFHHTPSCWKSRSPNRIIGLPHVTYCLPCDMVASNL